MRHKDYSIYLERSYSMKPSFHPSPSSPLATHLIKEKRSSYFFGAGLGWVGMGGRGLSGAGPGDGGSGFGVLYSQLTSSCLGVIA
jgi:hypothetical protein